MTDFCEREIYAIEETFEGYKTNIYMKGLAAKGLFFAI